MAEPFILGVDIERHTLGIPYKCPVSDETVVGSDTVQLVLRFPFGSAAFRHPGDGWDRERYRLLYTAVSFIVFGIPNLRGTFVLASEQDTAAEVTRVMRRLGRPGDYE